MAVLFMYKGKKYTAINEESIPDILGITDLNELDVLYENIQILDRNYQTKEEVPKIAASPVEKKEEPLTEDPKTEKKNPKVDFQKMVEERKKKLQRENLSKKAYGEEKTQNIANNIPPEIAQKLGGALSSLMPNPQALNTPPNSFNNMPQYPPSSPVSYPPRTTPSIPSDPLLQRNSLPPSMPTPSSPTSFNTNLHETFSRQKEEDISDSSNYENMGGDIFLAFLSELINNISLNKKINEDLLEAILLTIESDEVFFDLISQDEELWDLLGPFLEGQENFNEEEE